MQPGGKHCSPTYAAASPCNHFQRQVIFRYHIVDKIADKQRPTDFCRRRNPHHQDRNPQRGLRHGEPYANRRLRALATVG